YRPLGSPGRLLVPAARLARPRPPAGSGGAHPPGGSRHQSAIFSKPRNASEAMPADSGMVKIQAQMIRLARPHLMPRIRVVEPTPMMDPVMVWVVDTGMCSMVAPNSVMAPAVSAQKPPTG